MVVDMGMVVGVRCERGGRQMDVAMMEMVVGVRCERSGRQMDVTMVVKTRRWRGGGCEV
jgi:hypothetical protein